MVDSEVQNSETDVKIHNFLIFMSLSDTFNDKHTSRHAGDSRLHTRHYNTILQNRFRSIFLSTLVS